MEANPRSLLILLCTYNEAKNLPILVAQVQAALPTADFLVVDDNSPDGTGDWLRQAAISNSHLYLLSRPGKLGLGSAICAGMQWALDRNYEFLINMDADLSHRPADTPRLLEACQRSNCDVAVASRYLPGGGFTKIAVHRRLMSWSLNRYANWLLRLPLTDCSGSFRCYRTSALHRINLAMLSCTGYGFLEEILVALKDVGCTFQEVPIWFDARHMGRSKLGIRDAWGAIKLIHQLRNRGR